MNCLDSKTRAQIVNCLIEGCSIRATCRMTGAAKNTVVKLLADMGTACATFHDYHVRDLKVRRMQADTKLVVGYLVGGRDGGWALEFMEDCASRIRGRVQLTTDGHKPYLQAVEGAFGMDIDFATLQKIYGASEEPEKRYSPGKCIGCDMKVVMGNPDPAHVSTSYVERQNLTMRMSMRRFTRLTNGFSKKAENHCHAVALHYMYYNYCRVHQTLRVTPAMEAGLATTPWTVDDLIALLPKPTVGPSRIDRELYRKALGESA